jgi:WD repeat-containing protein 61
MLPVWSTSLSPDARTYASTSGSSGNVCIHDAAPGPTFGATISTLSIGRNKWGMHLRYNPDGSKVAMSTENGTVYVFDTQKQALVSTFASHAMCVRTLSWSADGKVRLTSAAGRCACRDRPFSLAPPFRL